MEKTSNKKHVAFICTIVVGVILVAVLILKYTRPQSLTGSRTPGQKLEDFYETTVKNTQSYFAK